MSYWLRFRQKQVDQLVELSEAYESENRENRARRRKGTLRKPVSDVQALTDL